MNWLSEWLPYIPPMLLSGIFNLLVAYQKLYRDFRSPFFNPWRSCGFWLWVLIQLTLPALVFCLYGKITTKPAIDFSLYGTAIQVGFFFLIFVNADADLGFTNFSVDKFYAFFNELAENQIADGQTRLLANFKTDFKLDLLQNPNNLDQGLNWLKDYFESDFVLKKNPTDLSEILAEIDRALVQSTNQEKVEAAIALVVKVRPKDCRGSCQRFGCTSGFLQKYFRG